jgi:sugar porter (SP) family MFS transporter
MELQALARNGDDALDVGRRQIVASTPAKRDTKVKPFLYLAAIAAALGGLIFGYDIAGAGATFVMDGFRIHFGWDCPVEPATMCVPATSGQEAFDKGLINGLFAIGAAAGALINPYIADNYGRRLALCVSNVVFIAGATTQSLAPVMHIMWTGRVFSGMGIGMLSMVVPVYIAEMAPEHARGKLGTLWQIAIVFGILLASAANLELEKWSEGWRISYGGNILFSLMLLASVLFLPESPRWLAAHGTEAELLVALHKVRFENEVVAEAARLREEAIKEKCLRQASWREIFARDNSMRYRVLLGCALQAFQQLCGINAIMFYAPDILATFFSSRQAIMGAFILNGINFCATFITLHTVDKFGRVKLLVSGGSIMSVALLANAVLASTEETLTTGWFVIAFAAVFIIGFAYSWGPVVWIYCSEIFPLRARGKATGLTTMTNWLATALVGAIFPAAQNASLTGCFIFFGCMIFAGVIVVYLFATETAGKTVLEIDEACANHTPKLQRWVKTEAYSRV